MLLPVKKTFLTVCTHSCGKYVSVASVVTSGLSRWLLTMFTLRINSLLLLRLKSHWCTHQSLTVYMPVYIFISRFTVPFIIMYQPSVISSFAIHIHIPQLENLFDLKGLRMVPSPGLQLYLLLVRPWPLTADPKVYRFMPLLCGSLRHQHWFTCFQNILFTTLITEWMSRRTKTQV